MHDLGKIGIPDSVLNKPGKLSNEEFKIIEKHAEIGYSLLKNSDRILLKTAAKIAYQHHEKWDGSGYPQGLKGDDICIEAQIVSISDVFDALSSDRVYRNAWPIEKILDLIRGEKGKAFSPKIVDAFFKRLPKIQEIFNDYQ